MSTNPPIPLGLIARSWPPANAWATRMLHPAALMLPAAPLAAGTRMSVTPEGVETWYLGTHMLVLHPGDASNMRQNLRMEPPRLWVGLAHADDPARVEVRLLTADPFEGEAAATDPGLNVGTLAMPPALVEHIAAFAALFPEEERFRKKRRSGIEAEDPSLHAPRILPGGYRPGDRRTATDTKGLPAAGLPRDRRGGA